MIIPYCELRVKKYKTHLRMSYCVLQSCPEYTDPTVYQGAKPYIFQISNLISTTYKLKVDFHPNNITQ